MRRRKFVALLGGAAAAWPLAVRAQQTDRLRRVGVFMDLAEADGEGQRRVAAFREGMRDLGWIEGRTVNYDYRWTAGDPATMERHAPELIALKPEVIMNGGLPHIGGHAEAHSNDSDRLCAGPRPRRSWVCREPCPSRCKHYGICQLRIFDGRKMA